MWFSKIFYIMVIFVLSVKGNNQSSDASKTVDKLTNVRLKHPSSNQVKCSTIRNAYAAKGFQDIDVPLKAIPGTDLKICGGRWTCCTEAMEDKLYKQSQIEFDSLVKESVLELKSVFETRTIQFNDFFRDLLQTSKESFNAMFRQTYGVLYERNSEIFSTMYLELERYYISGGVNLNDVLRNFFKQLYLKMFQILNSQYSFDDHYLDCVQAHMEQEKPFGDVPQTLILELRRSFVATRTFVQALATGKNLAENVMQIQPDAECRKSFMQLTYCPHCNGFMQLKPCSHQCVQVMQNCLAFFKDLDIEWNNYIDSLLLLSQRLQTSFNIEFNVGHPLGIKISEAIMNFQENSIEVSKRLFETCGKPRIGKRSPAEVQFEKSTSGEDFMYGAMPEEKPLITARGTNVRNLFQELKPKIIRFKGIWSKLPEIICLQRNSVPHVLNSLQRKTPNTKCWNGTHRVNSDGPSIEKLTNPVARNRLIIRQAATLSVINNKLTRAYQGVDVQWAVEPTVENKPFAKEEPETGSGSGSDSLDEAGNVDGEEGSGSNHTEGDILVENENVDRDDGIYFSEPHSPKVSLGKSSDIDKNESGMLPKSDSTSVIFVSSFRVLGLTICILVSSRIAGDSYT